MCSPSRGRWVRDVDMDQVSEKEIVVPKKERRGRCRRCVKVKLGAFAIAELGGNFHPSPVALGACGRAR